ncbi:hypothetical protein H6P81_013058 [Aristolochia fimbriata]|uniref:Uncharacterized protein n=1 Tax=Aristolochia fimbriata TaxID=158543 RepID=A0AAV7EDL8_ARIFI|nr:hypothetical protein H6P81_013058 [Aristolochia fimbriata]
MFFGLKRFIQEEPLGWSLGVPFLTWEGEEEAREHVQPRRHMVPHVLQFSTGYHATPRHTTSSPSLCSVMTRLGWGPAEQVRPPRCVLKTPRLTETHVGPLLRFTDSDVLV